ncbi:chymotrypsin inhibitor-like [Calliopsis andreniformis]|uniref:chymotrypsin inhibitor-like n=1 Tax=Calliopsis andreniformis TaxID=337506 RepID=UPI003FCE3548
MSRFFFVLLVLAVISASTFGQQCGLNEQWNDCGTACPAMCNRPKVTICTDQCVIGCQCKDGYLRNNEGTCVTQAEC